jgi:transaldolase
VADTGDFETLDKYAPQDSTTNPTLLLSAVQQERYKHLLRNAISYAKDKSSNFHDQVSLAIDKMHVNFGVEILKIVPGRVSTEIDARLSYDKEGSMKKVKEIINLYKEAGIDKERVLVKLASTWEGIQAAKELEREGIHCNMTLMFSLVQAAAASEANVTIVSPFVGRITDYYKQKEGRDFAPEEDPGVMSVKTIYNYFKKHGYSTSVMGASFRSKEQVLQLVGCDYLTLSPKILEDLVNTPADLVTRKLDPESAKRETDVSEKWILDYESFMQNLNKDEMANFKLGEGIRKFVDDTVKLENEISNQLQQAP